MKVQLLVTFCVFVVSAVAFSDERCPPLDDPEEPTVMLPHPAFCELFLICSHGNAVVSVCPPGLHWNDQAKRCDYPEQANCEQPGIFPDAPTRDNQCPEVYDPDHMVYISHESECGKYYICDPYGVPLLQECPAGLHWNPLVNYCDFPANVPCKQ
ncbi:peritrophin-1-like [Anopheles ziemanni]|uniref:peritrophin-1-like n=1 Tax=Anopheles coustani TaxID=139045 RepID=UPI0026583E81|nr:peritrophin-1-like [Anopheles coustani]XP_058178754.1 peritrophin-1-like [Anopheles ziemanni]